MPALIAHPQDEHLDRVLRRNQHDELLREPVTLLLEERVTLAVAHQGRRAAAKRPRRRRPELAGFLVAQVNGLRRRIAHGVVAPRRQAIELAIAGPGAAEAAFRDEKTARRVRDHVHPRPRRQCKTRRPVRQNAVFAAIGSESAQAVVEEQIGGQAHRRGAGRLPRATNAQHFGRPTRRLLGTAELGVERAAAAVEDHACCGLEQRAIRAGELIGLAQEDAAGPIGQHVRFAGTNRLLQLVA